MRELNINEYAMLELLAIQPLTFIPPLHRSTAEKLTREGLMRRHGEFWCATPSGLVRVGRTIH